MRHLILLSLLVMLGGCSGMPGPVVLSEKALPPADERTPLTILVADLAEYDVDVIASDESVRYRSKYPTTGTPIHWFRWQFEVMIPGGDIPSQYVGELESTLRVFISRADQENFRIRVQAEDAAGRTSEWTNWAAWDDTVPTVEVGQ